MLAALLLGVLSAMACGRTPGAARPAAPSSIVDREWELVALAEETNPRGAGGRPVTLRLDAASGRAVGFAGCNRFSASYTLTGDRLTFGAPISTRMACSEGMDLERRFLVTLELLTGYQANDDTLALSGPEGPLLRFRAP
jgi:heat shock protein HslJ